MDGSERRRRMRVKAKPTPSGPAAGSLASAVFGSKALRRAAYYADDHALIFNMDVRDALRLLARHRMRAHCIVTSPPFYGQRDYQVAGQIGLELHPREFIKNLVKIFDLCKPVLADNGSLWVNMGDTYWSGKGRQGGRDSKQSARRFGLRPQDRPGDGKVCVPKQLLLIPHGLAFAMQGHGWIVRGDIVWVKPNPVPDQVRDRCSISHEYVFHFVKQPLYYFNRAAVEHCTDTWRVETAHGGPRNGNTHRARFSEALVSLPILTTTPPTGIVLDLFAGSGTSLLFARKHGHRCIGIDLKREFCEQMVQQLREVAVEPTVPRRKSPERFRPP